MVRISEVTTEAGTGRTAGKRTVVFYYLYCYAYDDVSFVSGRFIVALWWVVTHYASGVGTETLNISTNTYIPSTA